MPPKSPTIKFKGPFIRFSEFGRCIYCDATDNLTEEHIIPRSIGGNLLVFPKASCPRCCDITKKFEQIFARDMLGAFRAKLRLPTRRPKERLAEVELEIVRDASSVRKIVHIDDLPVMLVLAHYPTPRLLSGKPPVSVFEATSHAVLNLAEVRSLADHPDDLVRIGQVNHDAIFRVLAKIAHGYAMAKRAGLFRPLLTDLILGRSDAGIHWVGCKPEIDPRVPNSCHWIELWPCEANGVIYLMAEIRLFRFLPTPTYWVVVGEDLTRPAGPIARVQPST